MTGEFKNSGEDSQGRIVLRIPPSDIDKYLASPDMYEALKEIAIAIADGYECIGYGRQQKKIEQTLKKAEGK